MEIIEENWKKINDIEELARKESGDPEAGFNPNLYIINGRALVIPVKFRKPKKNGDYTTKYYTYNTNAKYCPFTGRPLYKDMIPEDRLVVTLTEECMKNNLNVSITWQKINDFSVEIYQGYKSNYIQIFFTDGHVDINEAMKEAMDFLKQYKNER